MTHMIIGGIILVVCALILEHADHKGLKTVKNYATFGADIGLCFSAAGSASTMGWSGIVYMVLIAHASRVLTRLIYRAYLNAHKENTL